MTGERTLAEFAATPFEAWMRNPDGWSPPNAEEWATIGTELIVTVRLAFELLHKSKPELVDIMRDHSDSAGELIEPIPEMIQQLEIWIQILSGAHTRVLVAAAAVETESETKT